ncbi:hypothetical protein IVA87_31990 [Bradyrhizobium sp. 147]|uniref:hypothetical protein n=1 Tax=unclassified Bradyrhizobium TaxID=2631580 RepID=UPI001FF7604F|nr:MULTISPECIES: hypothetical protein [unclassified Bradyrhizobium]MCK1544526.1 hypothetical protein [Bradyrhizobium sp. 179]MCK1683879.1 hypothetical protein [Bradyrhizobium sp. 147]
MRVYLHIRKTIWSNEARWASKPSRRHAPRKCVFACLRDQQLRLAATAYTRDGIDAGFFPTHFLIHGHNMALDCTVGEIGWNTTVWWEHDAQHASQPVELPSPTSSERLRIALAGQFLQQFLAGLYHLAEELVRIEQRRLLSGLQPESGFLGILLGHGPVDLIPEHSAGCSTFVSPAQRPLAAESFEIEMPKASINHLLV